MKIKIPVGKIIALIGKAIRLSKGGISKDEALDLATDFAALAADIVSQVAEQEQS